MHTRRHFIKTVLLGATAAGFPTARGGADEGKTPIAKRLRGDHFATCHAVRDGKPLPAADVTASHDVVILGGGPSGLCAAHELRDLDLLLLEKEDALGGNCILDEWEGVRLSTGGAFYTESERDLVAFFAEIGAESLKVRGGDSLVVDGVPYTDFFRDGAARLPFPQKARDDFRRSRDELLALLKTKSEEELDAIPFSRLLEPYDPLVTRFWDRFGPSNWGGKASETSGYIGCEAYLWAGGLEDPRWTFAGGMAGGASALEKSLRPRLADRLVTQAAVTKVEIEGKSAIVRYVKDGAPASARARAVVVAFPKFYAAYVVDGLPDAQWEAMRTTEYAPYPVFNVCLNGAGPEPAYDNWFLDAPFTDFIPADWVLYGGHGDRSRRTALTVYHPLPQTRRAELLDDGRVLEMADDIAATLERHFPGTLDRITEIRVFRRGHPMYVSTPGRRANAEAAAAPCGPLFFANTDSLASVSSFAGALSAARRAAEGVRRHLRA